MSQLKKDAYAKRLSASIPAPLEEDSDSDFRAGPYIPEEKPKKGTRKSTGEPKRKKRRVDNAAEPKISSASMNRKKVSPRHSPPGGLEPNPLRKYFADVLDLHSEPEVGMTSDEGDAEDNEDEEEDEEDEEDEEKEDEEELPRPQWLLNLKKRTGVSSQSPNASKPGPADEDSATESESSQGERSKPKVGSSQSANNKAAPPKVDKPGFLSLTESETEPESDEERVKVPARPPPPKVNLSAIAKGKQRQVESDSETESESEPEVELTPSLRPKPGFPLKPNQTVQKALVIDETKKIKVPAAINTYLRDYQRDGVKFLYGQYKQGKGGLLGDDMGLGMFDSSAITRGKTIQVISFLSAIMKKNGVRTDKHRREEHVSKLQDNKAWRTQMPKANATWPTCLIIAPSTVVHNWEREFQKWGYFEVGIYTGNSKQREPVLKDFKLGRLDVVITSFDTARKDIELLDDLAWSCIIVDEVHRVKNKKSKIAEAYDKFHCKTRFGLTGTAIQNSYKELWTILDWTNPHQLGSAGQWQGYVVKPLTSGQSAGASEEERAIGMAVASILKNELLPNFFLRRTKDIIKDQLPTKTDQVVFCPLTPIQISAYKNILNTPELQNLVKRDEPCPCRSGNSRKNCCHQFVAGDVFRYMAVLIKLSNHLGLILPGGPNDSVEQTLRNREIAGSAFPDSPIPKYGMAMMQAQYCGKWKTLNLLLSEWKKDPTNKVLIFTKSVKLLEMLEFMLNNKSYSHLRLDGNTKQSERMPMIDQFNTDPDVFVFLISTLAGGTGLNLTGANKVVIFDPNWNPAHDLQAMDRAFRFGQTRDVHVYRLLGAGSVEELIYARQIYKQQQMAIGYDASIQTRYFEGIQGDNSKKGELFGLENIFKLHEDKVATKMVIENAHSAELDWALANMDAKSGGRKASKPGNELVEAGAKVHNDDLMGNMKGLGALLFDDDIAPPPKVNHREDAIQKTLSSIGVRYSHMNEQILEPSKIEEMRTKLTLENVRKRKRQTGSGKKKEKETTAKEKARHKKEKEKEPSPLGGSSTEARSKPQAPRVGSAGPCPAAPAPATGLRPRSAYLAGLVNPKPPVKKKVLSPEEQLHSRRRALVCLGMIEVPEDYAKFASDFSHSTEKERKTVLKMLDDFIADNPEDMDTDLD